MASLFEDLHSSDSEDDDYVPEGVVTSEDDDDNPLPEKDDEIKTKKNSRKKNGKALDAEAEKNKITEEPSSAVDQKQRANDLFKSFLEEVEADMKVKEPDVSLEEILKPPVSGVKTNEKTPEKPSSSKLFEFAGETFAVSGGNGVTTSEKSSGSEFEKNTNLESNMPGMSSNQLPAAKPKGLASVLSTIMNKKSKLTTLNKSKLDWNQYKTEQGISEELETFNKGRGGFIERKRFLERSDLRSYEIERDMKMTKRKKNC